MKYYYLKALWDGQGKVKTYYGMSRVKKQLSGKKSIGAFDALCDARFTIIFSRSSHSSLKKTTVTALNFNFSLLIKLNSRPKKTNSSCKFSACQLNLNSLAAQNFEKVGLLET